VAFLYLTPASQHSAFHFILADPIPLESPISQQTTNNKQQTTNNKQQTTNNKITALILTY
jgi:hypothetical protein